MVRLKVCRSLTETDSVPDFNSSMVRLKGETARDSLTLAIFQFQYGAIKSLLTRMTRNMVKQFQFQYGAIKSRFKPAAFPGVHIISIPVWCD